MDIVPLHSVRVDTPTFARVHIPQQRPVLIAGLIEDWPARHLWNAAYLTERFGHLEVPVRDYDAGSPYVMTRMTLAEYLAHWEAESERNLYLAEWNFGRDCPELADDFTTPPHFADDWIDELPENLQFGRLWVFIGHPRAHTPVHCDTFATSAWLSMVRGHKRVRLVHPDDVEALEARTDLFTNTLLDVRIFEATIAPGETLYIPGGWFHQVMNVDRNIMVTKNFVDTPNLLPFLSAFESRLFQSIEPLRKLRNAFAEKQIATCSQRFIAEQMAWSDEISSSLDRYRKLLAQASAEPS